MGWRNVHSEEVPNTFSSSNIIRLFKLSTMTCICSTHKEKRSSYKVFIGNPDGEEHFVVQGIDGRIVLGYMLQIDCGCGIE